MSSLREVQLYGLKILKEVVKVCDENGIKYHLSWGTLLGAIRHQGFIPWDNDIDITMPIADYRKFLEIAPSQLPKWLFVQTYKTDPGYNEMWAKVRANGTTSMPLRWKNYNIHFGIGIDIFPIIGWYESLTLAKLQKKVFSLCRLLLAREYLLAIDTKENVFSNWKLRVVYSLPWSIRCNLCSILSYFVFRDTGKSHKIAFVDTILRGELDATLFSGDRKELFEGYYFSAPLEVDKILTYMYGDYMIPPSPEKRGYGHELELGKIIYDCEKDYREYL